MSQPEALKEPGTAAFVTSPTSQKPEGGLLRSLRKFFAPGSQSIQSPTLRVVQPSPGLEGFAANFQQGIDGYHASVRQQEIESQKAEAARAVIALVEQAREAQRQREIEAQARTDREVAVGEAARILHDFQIRERLEYIRDTVWEGKGEVKPIDPQKGWLGGFGLVHSYPSFTKQEEEIPFTRQKGHQAPNYKWKYVPTTDSNGLYILALENSLGICSFLTSDRFEETRCGVLPRNWEWQDRPMDDPRGISQRVEPNVVIVRMDVPESETLLQAAITQVVIGRVARRLLPAQTEKEAYEGRQKLPHWQKWIKQFHWEIYHEQHPYIPGSD